MSESEALVVLCTAPDADTAARLARGLVQARLAACVNVIGGVRSFYQWKGEVQDDAELQLLCKTDRAHLDALMSWVRAEHPYEVPELLALPVVGGSPAYLDWIHDELIHDERRDDS